MLIDVIFSEGARSVVNFKRVLAAFAQNGYNTSVSVLSGFAKSKGGSHEAHHLVRDCRRRRVQPRIGRVRAGSHTHPGTAARHAAASGRTHSHRSSGNSAPCWGGK